MISGRSGDEHAGDRVDPHHLERLARLERRQDRRQPASEHRLARSGRAGEQKVVTAGGGELERAAGALLAADVGQVGRIGLRRLVGRLGRRRTQLAAQVARRPRRGAATGTASTPPSSASQADSGAQRIRSSPARRAPSATANAPAHRSHATVQRELADRGVLGEPLGRDLPRGGQDRQRDREVEARALLAQAGRRQVDGDPLQRPLELRRADAAPDPVLRLRARAVGEPDDREAGHAGVDVRLDLDAARLEADERVGDGAREHAPNVDGEGLRMGYGSASVPHNRSMDAETAARRWAEVWTSAWPARDADAIAALYSNETSYRALAFREPDLGLAGVRRYLDVNFAVESEIECWFGEPVVSGDRAAVEWWGTWVEQGQRLTLAGTSILRFDDDGKVVDHRDYWNEVERREPPYEGW